MATKNTRKSCPTSRFLGKIWSFESKSEIEDLKKSTNLIQLVEFVISVGLLRLQPPWFLESYKIYQWKATNFEIFLCQMTFDGSDKIKWLNKKTQFLIEKIAFNFPLTCFAECKSLDQQPQQLLVHVWQWIQVRDRILPLPQVFSSFRAMCRSEPQIWSYPTHVTWYEPWNRIIPNRVIANDKVTEAQIRAW